MKHSRSQDQSQNRNDRLHTSTNPGAGVDRATPTRHALGLWPKCRRTHARDVAAARAEENDRARWRCIQPHRRGDRISQRGWMDMTNKLGDGPVQPEYVEQMRAVTRVIDQFFNGPLKG